MFDSGSAAGKDDFVDKQEKRDCQVVKCGCVLDESLQHAEDQWSAGALMETMRSAVIAAVWKVDG